MAQRPPGKLVKAAALLTSLQVAAQATAFLKQLVIAALFGTTALMDGFLVSLTIIQLLGVWLSLPVKQILIPMIRHDLKSHGEAAARTNISILFNNFVVVLCVVAALGWWFSPALVSLVAPGFDAETDRVTVLLTRIAMPSVVFLVLGAILTQMYYSYERFLLPGVAQSLDNLVNIVVIVVACRWYGIYGLAAAVVLGDLFQVALQLPILRKHFTWRVDLRHPKMVEMGKVSFPLFISTGGRELSRLNDRIFASMLPAGSLSALSYGSRLVALTTDFFLDPLHQSTYPHFTRLVAENRMQQLSEQLFHYLRLTFFLTLPMAVGLVLVADPLVAAVFQRGAFDASSTLLTSQALACYAIGFPAIAAGNALNGVFFAFQDTWTASKISLARFGVKILLSWILIQHFAHTGLALAESASQILRVVPLFLLLPAPVRGSEGGKTLRSMARTCIGAAVMGLAVYTVGSALPASLAVPLRLGAEAGLGLAVYVGVAALLPGEELPWVLETLRSFAVRLSRGRR